MDPVTISSIIGIGLSIAQLLGPKGPSIADLMAIQAQMIKKISEQIIQINDGILLIASSLDDLRREIYDIPNKTVLTNLINELKGVIFNYQEIINGFIQERDTNGILSAHNTYDNRIKSEILFNLHVIRGKIFYDIHEPVLIPIIAATLQIEVHCMILEGFNNSEFKAALNSYYYWLSIFVSQNGQFSIPQRIVKLRNDQNTILQNLKKFPNVDKCTIRVSSEFEPNQRIIYDRIIDYYQVEYILSNNLNDKQTEGVNQLINSSILKNEDINLTILSKEKKIVVGINYESFSQERRSTNPQLIPVDTEESFSDALEIRMCSVQNIGWQKNQVDALSSQYYKNALSILALGSLQKAAEESVNAINKYNQFGFLINNKRSGNYKSNLPSLRLGQNVDQNSAVLNLANMSLGGNILQLVSFAFRDDMIENQANQEFNILQERITQSISNPNFGFLLQVSIYVNEFGHIILPYGQLLYPVGIGIEPLDAYAESLRKPQIRPYNPSLENLQNNSFFLWITKSGTTLVARTIPKEFREYFTKVSNEEATRRDRIAQWRQYLPFDQYESIERAKYWIEAEKAYISAVQDTSKQKQISELTSNMQRLESEVNQLYLEYQLIQSEITRQQNFTNTLNTISNIGSILRTALQIGKMVCTNNSSTTISGSELKPKEDIPATLNNSAENIIHSGSQQISIKMELKLEFQMFQDYDSSLDNLYKQNGIPLPIKPDLILPKLP